MAFGQIDSQWYDAALLNIGDNATIEEWFAKYTKTEILIDAERNVWNGMYYLDQDTIDCICKCLDN